MKSDMLRRFIPLLLTIISLLLLPLSAEELWVRNRPFQGQVEGKGNSMKVDLDALLKALELEATIQGNEVIFGDFKVPIETDSSGVRMVLLRDMATGAGLRIRKNPDLGTVDVFTETAGSGDKGDFSAISDSSNSTSRSSSGNGHEKPDYRIKVPSGLEYTDDPSMMAFLKDYVGQRSGGAPDNTSFEFILKPRKGNNDAVLLLMKMTGLPPLESIPPEVEAKMVEGFASGVARKGRILSGPTKLAIGGKTFFKVTYASVEKGENKKNEAYMHVSAPRGTLYALLFGDRENDFNRSAPLFRQAINNFYVK